MLFTIPEDVHSFSKWLIGIIIEVLIISATWRIDTISSDFHALTSSRWHIDPTAASSSCRSPVEIGKLTACSFVISVVSQIVVVVLVAIVRKKELQVRDSTFGVLSREHFDESNLFASIDGLPEVIYACYASLCMIVAGGVTYKSLNVYLFHPRRFSFCPHLRVIGIFKFSIFANACLFILHALFSFGAIRLVITEALGFISLRATMKNR